jgi:hypothetical protein
MPARTALPESRDPLLDDAAAEIGVDKPTRNPRDSLPQAIVRDPLTSREADEPSGFENAHATSYLCEL